MPEQHRPEWMRQRGHHLVVILVAAAILIAGGGLVFGGGAARDDAVPWADQPVPRPSGPISTKPQPRPAAQPCRAGDLEALWPEGGSTFADGTGATGFAVLVRNVGAAPCTLSGHPRAQPIGRDGEPAGPPAQDGSYLPGFGRGDGVATIEPGEPARFFLSMSSAGCAADERTYHSAEVRLDNGFGFTVENAWLQGTCPPKVSAWEPISDEAGQFGALEARVQTPPSIEPGEELRYTLELINVTASTVRLEPCLVFTHAIGPEQAFDLEELDDLVHSTHQLNCAAGDIGPYESIRYQMKFFIPQHFPQGPTILHWMAEGSPRPSASAMFIVGRQPAP